MTISASRTAKLGSTVATVGFPNTGLQGFAPKLARGEIAALSGALDDPRYFQISVPIQPGNSGGAFVDERGNVVGVVSTKLSANAALATSGALPENVNYAVKSSFLLSGDLPSSDGILDNVRVVPERPALSIRVSQLELCWDSTPTNSYQLQYRSSLTTNQWVNFGSLIVGDGSRRCASDFVPQGEPERYYQLVIMP